jgi:hypothetical protein
MILIAHFDLELYQINVKTCVVQIYCTRKCTNCLQYNGLQVRGQTHSELYS